ncbi:MAG: hypothetical protein ABW199_10300, partial [Caulobacterales bacterium]
MRIGDMEILPVSDGHMVFNATETRLFDIANRHNYEDHKDYITRSGAMVASLGAFLVRTGDRVMLLDAGMGPRKCGAECDHNHAH